MKAIILARVSTTKQEKEGLSLREMQLPRLRQYAQERGFEVVEEFVFSESADQKIRTKFNEMLEFVKKSKDVKCIVAFRVDRITRNFRDQVQIDTLMREHDVALHFVEDRLIINKDTVGRDIQDWDLKVFLGKQYINRLKEDATNSAYYKLHKGEWPGKAPFGYINCTYEKNKKWINTEDAKAAIVKFMFNSYASGATSMGQLRVRIKEEFGTEVSKGKIDQILRCKFYHGVMEYKGKTYKHNYETIISEELFDQVQQVKANYNKASGYKFAGLPFPYRGLIKCSHCSSAVTPERKKGKYVYYKCTEYHGKHGAKYVREEALTEQFKEAFRKIKIPQWVAEKISKTLKESHQDKINYSESLLLEHQKEYKKYKTRIEKMYEDRLDGRISEEEFDERAAAYREKQKHLQAKIGVLQEADDSYYFAAEALLDLASRAEQLFESSKVDQKRELIKLTLSNLVLKEEKLEYYWNEPFATLASYSSRSLWLPRLGSNQRPIG